MAATMEAPIDLSSSTGIEQHMRSREELAEQVALLRLERAAAAFGAWRELHTDEPTEPLDAGEGGRLEVSLLERFERVTGRPLAAACPSWCTCRGIIPAGQLGGDLGHQRRDSRGS
jgi:hypothetical protein